MPLPLGVVLAGFAGLSDLIGSALVLGGRQTSSRWFDFLLAFGTGFVLAIALAELVPAGLEGGTGNAFWVLAGFSALYLITRFFEEDERAAGISRGLASGIGLTMLGVTLCDFFDGLAVAAATVEMAAVEGAQAAGGQQLAGWLLLIGLFPHNFLEGGGIALLLLRAGMSRGSAWVAVSCLALASALGGVVAVQAAIGPALQSAVQAFAGGLLLHLVASQRIPAFTGSLSRAQAALVVAGIGTFLATGVLLELVGLEI